MMEIVNDPDQLSTSNEIMMLQIPEGHVCTYPVSSLSRKYDPERRAVVELYCLSLDESGHLSEPINIKSGEVVEVVSTQATGIQFRILPISDGLNDDGSIQHDDIIAREKAGVQNPFGDIYMPDGWVVRSSYGKLFIPNTETCKITNTIPTAGSLRSQSARRDLIT